MSSGRARWPSFLRAVLWVAAASHVTFLIVAAEAARRLGAGSPWLVGAALAATLFGAFVARLRAHVPDRPRSRWTLHLVDEPLFAHFCASLCSAVPIAVGCTIVPLAQLVLGRAPAVPTGFALVTYAGSLALSAWGVFVRRRWVLTREVEIGIPGLPAEFDGYRVVQLSDLHIGSLTPSAWGERWAQKTNDAMPDLVVITGDLVTSGVGFHEDIARVVGGIRAQDGVLVSLGNHDYFGEGEPLISLLRERGVVVLRNEGVLLSRGDGRMLVAGVDDTWTRRDDLSLALADKERAPVTVLLAHDPAVFPVAAALGASLVLSGHTHGGQVALPFFARRVSLGKLAHRFHLGLYRHGEATLYVHPGLGTTGPPIRLGVAPEIAVIKLRAA